MKDCNQDIKGYHSNRVKLTPEQKKKLQDRCNSNRDRLRRGLEKNEDPKPLKWVLQGSYAMQTTIQEHRDEYDIDDGVVFTQESLQGLHGANKVALDARKMVRDAVDDGSFKQKPQIKTNCVRVHYNDGPHVDIPVYRSVRNWNGTSSYELASADWKESNPEGVNSWFKECIALKKGYGLKHFRELIRLLKSFCKNRGSYSLPSGFVLTVLVNECYITGDERLDIDLCRIIKSLYTRLSQNLYVNHPVVSEWLIDETNSHKTEKLRDILGDAVQKLEYLNQPNCTYSQALKIWKKVLNTNYFDDKIIKSENDEKNRTRAMVAASPYAPKPYAYIQEVRET